MPLEFSFGVVPLRRFEMRGDLGPRSALPPRRRPVRRDGLRDCPELRAAAGLHRDLQPEWRAGGERHVPLERIPRRGEYPAAGGANRVNPPARPTAGSAGSVEATLGGRRSRSCCPACRRSPPHGREERGADRHRLPRPDLGVSRRPRADPRRAATVGCRHPAPAAPARVRDRRCVSARVPRALAAWGAWSY